MRYTKGEWVASYRDTWNLDSTLNPIIAAGIKKFIEMVENPEKCAGVPTMLVRASDNPGGKDLSMTEAQEQWLLILDKMLYAFDDNEPNILHYNFDFKWDTSRPVVGNEVEAKRYNSDMKEHDEKVQEGLDLFAKYYKCLWW